MLRSAISLAASVLLVSACSKPTFEGYVFWRHGPGTKIVSGNLPSNPDLQRRNRYLIPVGSITWPKEKSPIDFIEQKAAIWDVNTRCPHRAFVVDDLTSTAIPDGTITYIVNFSNFPVHKRNVEEDFPTLPKQYIGYMDYLVVKITNGRFYQATSEQLVAAQASIERGQRRFESGQSPWRGCSLLSQSSNRFQVTGIFVADFDVDIGYSAGVDVTLPAFKKDDIRAAAIRSYRFRSKDPGSIYGIIARPI
jgi:hypothetical protein